MTQDLRFVTLLVMHRVRDPLDKKGISGHLAWGGGGGGRFTNLQALLQCGGVSN